MAEFTAPSGQRGCVISQYVTYYPPPSGATAYPDANPIYLQNMYSSGAGKYRTYCVLIGFDTSSIPDDAIIVSATLKLYVNAGKAQADANMRAEGEYFDFGAAVDVTDWHAPDSGAANAFSGVNYMAWTDNAYNDITLSNLNNINKTGYTRFRIDLSMDAAPTENNYVPISGSNAPKLEVTYSVVEELAGSMTAGAVSSGSIRRIRTITATFAAGAAASGSAGVIRSLAGSMNAEAFWNAIPAPKLSMLWAIAGQMSAGAGASANFGVTYAFAGEMLAGAAAEGSVGVTYGISGELLAGAEAAAALQKLIGLSGTLSAGSSIWALLDLRAPTLGGVKKFKRKGRIERFIVEYKRVGSNLAASWLVEAIRERVESSLAVSWKIERPPLSLPVRIFGRAMGLPRERREPEPVSASMQTSWRVPRYESFVFALHDLDHDLAVAWMSKLDRRERQHQGEAR